MKIHKRLVALALAAITVVSSTPLTCFADNIDDYPEYQSSAMISLASIADNLQPDGSGEYALVHALQYLAEYAMYSSYAATFSEEAGGKLSVGFYEKDWQAYRDTLLDAENDFNDKFAEDSKRYTALKLDTTVGGETVTKFNAYVNTFLSGDGDASLVSYLDTVLKDIQDNAPSDSDKLKEKYGVLLETIYVLVEDVYGTVDDIANITPEPAANKPDANRMTFDELQTKLTALKTTYADLYEVGQEVATEASAADDITLDDTKTALENLAELVQDDDMNITVAEYPALKMSYDAILSAGATYTPFASYVGNSTFMHALKSLPTDDETAGQLAEVYNKLKDFKKPLYKRDLDDAGRATGTASLISVADFMSEIENGTSGALVAMEGDFIYDTTQSSWIYSADNSNDYSDNETNMNVTGNSTDALDTNTNSTLQGTSSGTSSTSATSENTTASNKLRYELNVNAVAVTGSTTADNSKTNADANPTATNDANASDPNAGTGTDAEVDGTNIDNEDLIVSTVDGETATDDGTTIIDTDLAMYAKKQLSTEDRMTQPLFLYGTKFSREIDNMTTMILKNVIENTASFDKVDNMNTNLLYVNAFGDLVTKDDLVILPGIANPILYRSDSKYNPFTVAFMNSYPVMLNNTSYFQLASKADVGKYLMFMQVDDTGTSSDDNIVVDDSDTAASSNGSSGTNGSTSTSGSGTSDENSESNINNSALNDAIVAYNTQKLKEDVASFNSGVLTSVNGVKAYAPVTTMEIQTQFIANGYDKYDVFAARRLIFGKDGTWSANNPLYTYTPIIIKNNISIDGKKVFPYEVADDVDCKLADAIADNIYQFLATDDKTNKSATSSKLNDNYIIHYFLINGSQGTNDSSGYEDSLMFQYETYVNDAADRAETKLEEISKSLFKHTTSVDGVLGIKNSYEDPIVGRILLAIQDYWFFFALIFILVLIVAFAKVHRDMIGTFVMLFAGGFMAYAFIVLIPVYAPMAYNMILNNVSDNFAYKILAERAEYFDTSDSKSTAINSDGEYKYNTGSLTLYRSSTSKIDQFYAGINIDKSDACNGKTYIVNQENGTFVEGDSLKINTDVLFDTLKIDGEVNSDNAYELKSTKTVSNNVDYYTPYYQLVDNFIAKLNALSTVYSIPESTKDYSNGRSKNNYLVYCYVNSAPFLTPDDYSVKLPEDTSGWSDEDVEEYENTGADVQEALEAAFPNNIDWLGLDNFLYNEVPAAGSDYQQTLWAQTMLQNGFYTRSEDDDNTWVPNQDKLDGLITYVNYQTKKFVFSITDTQIGSLSDDVMVKIISLRALIAFTQRVSYYSNWLYPYSINYPEITLGNVETCMFVSDYDNFIATGMNIVDYISDNYGWLHLISFDVLTVLLFLITYLMKFLVGVMYLALALIIIVKLVTTGEFHVPWKGYLKCMLVVMFNMTLLCISIVVIQRINGSPIAIYAEMLVIAFILYLLSSVVIAVVTNFMDLGEVTLGGQIMSPMSKIVNKVKSMRVSSTSISAMHKHLGKNKLKDDVTGSSFSKYGMDAKVDDFYGASGRGFSGSSNISYADDERSRRGHRNSNYDEDDDDEFYDEVTDLRESVSSSRDNSYEIDDLLDE